MESWVERKRCVEGKQKVREGTKTRPMLIIAGLLGKKRMMAGG